MAAPALAVSAVLIFSSMLASFSIPLMLGRGSGGQMLMIDAYYRFGQHGDFETASALGVVSYLLAMGAALVYARRLTRQARPRRPYRADHPVQPRFLRRPRAAPEPGRLVTRRTLALS